MQRARSLQFKEITRLRFLDVKAQKKTIQYKKFQNVQLSEEEKVKQKYQSVRPRDMEDYENSGGDKSMTKHSFRKSLNKLARPRNHFKQDQNENKEINSILKKCKRLMHNGNRVKVQMTRFEKSSRLCLSEIERKMNNVISDGLSANYYI